MNEQVSAAVSALRALGYKNVTEEVNEAKRLRYIALHGKEPPPDDPHTEVWHWRSKDMSRFVQVIVNTKTGLCLTSMDVPGDCLGDALRAAKAGESV